MGGLEKSVFFLCFLSPSSAAGQRERSLFEMTASLVPLPRNLLFFFHNSDHRNSINRQEAPMGCFCCRRVRVLKGLFFSPSRTM